MKAHDLTWRTAAGGFEAAQLEVSWQAALEAAQLQVSLQAALEAAQLEVLLQVALSEVVAFQAAANVMVVVVGPVGAGETPKWARERMLQRRHWRTN